MVDSIKSLHGNSASFFSKPKSLETDKNEFSRFHPDKVWKNDADVSACASCNVSFGLRNRKHHCRECGDVFCSDCSSRQIVVHGTLKRCCSDCYRDAIAEHTRPGYHGGSDNVDDDVSRCSIDASADRNTMSSTHSFARASFMADHLVSSPLRTSGKDKKNSILSKSTNRDTPIKMSSLVDDHDGGVFDNVFKYPNWVEAMVYVRVELTEEGRTESSAKNYKEERACTCYPEGVLPSHMLQDIAETAVPDRKKNVDSGHGMEDAATENSDVNFMFRTRDRSVGGLLAPNAVLSSIDETDTEQSQGDITSATLFFNCYVALRETVHEVHNGYSSSRTSVKHALVLVSRWPFPLLAFYTLFKLDEAFSWSNMAMDKKEESKTPMSLTSVPSGKKEQIMSDSSSKTQTQSIRPVVNNGQLHADFLVMIMKVLTIGHKELQAFPKPEPGTTMSCPFLGETLQYKLPPDIKPTYGENLSLAAAANAVNLVVKFAPSGLLNHIWELWELVATGKDILVLSNNPAHSSEVTLALASMLCPLGYNGDCRPFMQSNDKDVPSLRKMSQRKQQERRDYDAKIKDGTPVNNSTARTIRNSSIIIGATDLKMLELFNNFDACIVLDSECSKNKAQTAQQMSEQIRQRNAAKFRVLQDDELLKDAVDIGRQSSSKTQLPAMSQGQNTLVLLRSVLQTTIDRDVVRTIQNMDSLASMTVLGDKLVRDRLSAMTVAFFKPIDSNVTLEVAEMRSAALERVKIAEHQRQVQSLQKRLNEEINKRGLLDIPGALNTLTAIKVRLPWMMPTIIMWILYILCAYTYVFVVKLPLPPLLGVILTGVLPEQAPKKFERLLRILIPLWILYPLVFDTHGRRKDGRDGRRMYTDDSWDRVPSNTVMPDDEGTGKKRRKSVTINEQENNNIGETSVLENISEDAAVGSLPPRANFSGLWKRTKTVDYDKFLMAQGASWMKGRLASSIALEHTMTMDEGGRYFRLMEKGGPVNTDFTYTIDGVTVDDTIISDTKFKDCCSWDKNILLVVKKVQPKEDYELVVHRHLDDPTHMRVVALFNHYAKPEKNITATSYFEKIGPSPYQEEMDAKVAALGPSVQEAENGESSTEEPANDSSTPSEETLPIVEATLVTDVNSTDSQLPPSPSVSAGRVRSASYIGEEIVSANSIDFGGTWLRTGNDNYDAILFSLGLSHKQRRSALANKMTLSIKMTKDLQCVHITETASVEGGNRDRTASDGSDDMSDGAAANRTTETSYEVNVNSPSRKVSPAEITILGHRYIETATFLSNRNQGQGILRICQTRRDKSCENIIELRLTTKPGSNEQELIMKNVYRDLQNTGNPGVEAIQTFNRLSPDEVQAWNDSKKSSTAVRKDSPPKQNIQDSAKLRKLLEGNWESNDEESTKISNKISISLDTLTVTLVEKTGSGPSVNNRYRIGENAVWRDGALIIKKKKMNGKLIITSTRSISVSNGYMGDKVEMRVESVVTDAASGQTTDRTVVHLMRSVTK